MSWTKVAATVLVVVLAGWVTSATAAESEYGRSGPFVSASADYAFESFSSSAGSPSPDNSWGYSLEGGYRFNEYFALQVGWQHFVDFNRSAGGSARFWMIGLDGKFYPFHGMVQPFLSAGAGLADAKDPSLTTSSPGKGFGARVGAGFDFYVARNWALTTSVDYVIPTGKTSDYATIPISFGVLYRFY